MTAPLIKVLHKMQELFQNVFAALETILLFPSLFRNHSGKGRFQVAYWRRRTLDSFADEVESLFSAPLSTRNMLTMSEKIREQFRSSLQSSPMSMLPSYTHMLPSGTEKGTFIALDVGGSTFRVALIELRGNGHMEILRVKSDYIDNNVKLLEGTLFFDWMAEKIASMLGEVGENCGRGSTPLSMGLSWSFPIEQTSVSSGLVIHMGKGFLCSDGTVGQELGDLIVQSCRKRGLNVQVDAIVNDSSATLLSRAYGDPKTRMSLILGTGTNVAIHFPVHEIGTTKFGVRPQGWFDRAKHVIVNSEMSMFGGSREFGVPRDTDIEIDPKKHEWVNYFKAGLLGALKVLRKERSDGSFCPASIEALVDGNVPPGGGISSSAAFVCSSALAVMKANNHNVSKQDLLDLAVVSERAVGVYSGG